MARERVTITIKEDLLQQVDRLVDGLTIRSRSQAVEYLLTKFLSDFRLKNALVLAGGEKKDLLFGKKVKFLENLNGKPLLQHVLDEISEFNVNNFLIYVDNFGGEIVGELNSRNLPYKINFLKGDKPSGTIAPLLSAREQMNDIFLVAYGDTLCDLNINEMLAFHRKNKCIATIALTTVSNPKDYGVVSMEGSKVKEFVQKPKKDFPSYLVSAGYFILEPEIFKHISRNMHSLEKDLFPKLAKKNLLNGYVFQGRYVNVNTKSDLEKARVFI